VQVNSKLINLNADQPTTFVSKSLQQVEGFMVFTFTTVTKFMKRRHSESTGTSAKEEHEQLIARLLKDTAKREAGEWIESGGDEQSRSVGSHKTKKDSLNLVQEIYRAGAVKVTAVNIHRRPKGSGEHAGKLVVELPQDSIRREAIFEWCKGQGESLGQSPEIDQGERYLFLLLD
jgi:hypothetical protein